MEKRETVSFKGMADGVRINLGEEEGIFELLESLKQKILANKAFFGDGDCRISFGGRRLSGSDKQRLEELLKTLLPLCRVSFESDSAKSVTASDWLLAYRERAESANEKAETEPNPEQRQPEEFISVFRSNRARFYEGTLKDGMTLRSDGHLILRGTVSEGASLIAAGNIIVIGGLYGTAHAGCNGHNGSYITAFDMRPEGLAIAQTAETYTYSDETRAEEDTAEGKKKFFGVFRKKTEEDESPEEKPDLPFLVTALLKNNKIQFDNFTIGDFTNSKNMV